MKSERNKSTEKRKSFSARSLRVKSFEHSFGDAAVIEAAEIAAQGSRITRLISESQSSKVSKEAACIVLNLRARNGLLPHLHSRCALLGGIAS